MESEVVRVYRGGTAGYFTWVNAHGGVVGDKSTYKPKKGVIRAAKPRIATGLPKTG